MSLKVINKKPSNLPRLEDIDGVRRKDKNLCGICDETINPNGVYSSGHREDYGIVQIGIAQNERPIKGKVHLAHYRLRPKHNLGDKKPEKGIDNPCGVCGDEVILKNPAYGSMKDGRAFQEHALRYVPGKNPNSFKKTYDHLGHYVLKTSGSKRSVNGRSTKR